MLPLSRFRLLLLAATFTPLFAPLSSARSAETAPAGEAWQFARLVEQRHGHYVVLRTFGRRVFAASRYRPAAFGKWHQQRPIPAKYLPRLGLPPGSTAWHTLTAAELHRLGLDRIGHGRDFYFQGGK